jgi:hypothetical protein
MIFFLEPCGPSSVGACGTTRHGEAWRVHARLGSPPSSLCRGGGGARRSDAAPLHDWAGLVRGSILSVLFPCRIALGVRLLSIARTPHEISGARSDAL